MYILSEASDIKSAPKTIKKMKDRIRLECILQTVGDVNRNKRRYSKSIIQESVSSLKPRLKEGSFMGELDHPIDNDPVRQITVLYKEASHQFKEMGWDGNKLVGILETVRTPNGMILKNLAEDGIPVGFSFRGMGDLRELREAGSTIFEVVGPLHTVTWDCVSFPSHQEAKMIKITESVNKVLQECVDFTTYTEKKGVVTTNKGERYFANDFDKLLDIRTKILLDKFKR